MRYQHINRSTISGFAAIFVGNGIGRFAFIAIFPALVQQAWFSSSQVSYFGAFTLLGYLLGIPLNSYLTKRISSSALLQFSMLTCSLSYFACTWQSGGFYWFMAWRTLVGISGAILMVLGPYMVLTQCDTNQRARFSGVIFSGIGIGVMASGMIVPLMLKFGLKTTWTALGMICLLLTLFTWNQWKILSPKREQNFASASSASGNIKQANNRLLSIILLLSAYALNAVGYLPHTLFWVVYINQELHMSIAAGGFFWGVFGVGAAIGPFITTELSARISLPKTLLISFMLKAYGVVIPLFSNSPIALFFSSLLVGMFTPGITNIVSSCSMNIAGIAHYKKTWGSMTFSFALAQALGGYLMALIMTTQKSYHILFLISFIALLISVICIIFLMRCEQDLSSSGLRSMKRDLNQSFDALRVPCE